jgi:hypothetical protein
VGPPDPTGEFVAGPVTATIAAMHVEVKEGLPEIESSFSRAELVGGRCDRCRLGSSAAACDGIQCHRHYDQGCAGDHAPGDVLA